MAANERTGQHSARLAGRRGVRVKKVAVSGAAVGVAVAHLVRPDLTVDAVIVALLVVALLPWLDDVFESVQTPLGGVKYRDLEERVNELSGATDSLTLQARASDAADAARRAQGPMTTPESLEDLAREYNALRKTPRGEARTAAMTSVVGRMVAAVDGGASLDIGTALRGDDLGLRLAAYCSLFARPQPTFVVAVVDSIIDKEPKPFGQYWGLRCLTRLVDVAGSDLVDRNTERRIRRFLSELPFGSDRYHELKGLLDRLDAR